MGQLSIKHILDISLGWVNDASNPFVNVSILLDKVVKDSGEIFGSRLIMRRHSYRRPFGLVECFTNYSERERVRTRGCIKAAPINSIKYTGRWIAFRFTESILQK